MRWKIKNKQGDVEYHILPIIFPRKYRGYWYWLEWGLFKYTHLGWRWSRSGDLIGVGSRKQMIETLKEKEK